MADPQQNYRDVLSRLEAKDKEGTNLQDVYDFLSLMPGTGDVIGAYEAPGIISAGVERMGQDDLSEKVKGAGIAALGVMGMIPVAGKGATKAAKVFSKIDTPVYHFSRNTDPGFTKFDQSKLSFFDLGPHVGSTPRAAQDRFIDETFGVGTRLQIRKKAADIGKSKEEAFEEMIKSGELKIPEVSGNVGYKQFGVPIPRRTKGGSIPLKADLSKPFLNPDTGKPFSESQLMDYQAEQYSIHKGEYVSASDILGEDPKVDIQDVKQFMRAHSRGLAELGFTHIPYENAVEGVGDLSYVMLVDRPKGSTKVLQSPFAKKDPAAADDPDIMKEEGGVVSMKDKAVNMTRKPQGIEPFIKFVV